MTQRLHIVVPGPPQPKERARLGPNGRWYTPAKTKRYEKAVRGMMQLVAPRGWPTDATYEVVVWAYFGDGRARDADNVLKACLDAGNECLWRDDSQVIDTVAKRRIDRERPRTEITVTVLS